MASATLPDSDRQPPAAASRGLLDPLKRRLLLKFVAKGPSRRAAARAVGCHTATVGRTAARDPEFAPNNWPRPRRPSASGPWTASTPPLTTRILAGRRLGLGTHPAERFTRHAPHTVTAEGLANVINRVLERSTPRASPRSRWPTLTAASSGSSPTSRRASGKRSQPYLQAPPDDSTEPLLPEPRRDLAPTPSDNVTSDAIASPSAEPRRQRPFRGSECRAFDATDCSSSSCIANSILRRAHNTDVGRCATTLGQAG